MRHAALWRRIGVGVALTVLMAGCVLASIGTARAATDPYPSNLTIEGDSGPQLAVQDLETSAFNAGDLGTLSPKYLAVTPGEDQARADLASGLTDMAATSEGFSSADLATAQQTGLTLGTVPYGLTGVAIVVGVTISHTAPFPQITSLNLTIPTLCKLFTHQITSFSASEVVNENPSEAPSLQHVALETPIQVVDRRTASPTTAALIAAFLADPTARACWDTYAALNGSPRDTVLDVWPDDPGTGVTSGEQGVISTVLAQQASGPPAPQNAIGYVTPEWAAANTSQGAITVSIAPSGSSTYIAPDAAGIQAAFSSPGVTFDSSTDLYTIDYTKLTNSGAYPIPLPAYLAAPITGGRANKAAATYGMLKYAVSVAGQAELASATDDSVLADMVPLPANALQAAQAEVAKFNPANLSGNMSTATTTTSMISTQVTTQATTSDAGTAATTALVSDLPTTGGRIPVGPAAIGLAMLVTGHLARRRVLRRRSPPPLQ
jgi:hypothetical protein